MKGIHRALFMLHGLPTVMDKYFTINCRPHFRTAAVNVVFYFAGFARQAAAAICVDIGRPSTTKGCLSGSSSFIRLLRMAVQRTG